MIFGNVYLEVKEAVGAQIMVFGVFQGLVISLFDIRCKSVGDLQGCW